MPKDRLVWGLSTLILIAAFLVSPGFFSIDEAIYYLGGRALAEGGSLGIHNNGFEQFHSEALKLRFLVDGPQGLTPQYPAGSALLAAPLLPFLGPRAFILINAVAAVLTLFTVRNICLSQFKSEAIAKVAIGLLVGGTFWLEYAFGIWPHMISAFLGLEAYWFALRHLERDSKGDVILSGLFAGLGMMFRLDAAFAVPAIGLMLVIFAPRFFRSSLWFGVGLLPTLILSSGIKYLKFGSPNPFSYGQAGGNTDLAAYGPIFAALCVGFGLLVMARKVEWRVDHKVAVAAIALLGVLVAVPATNAWLLRFCNGFLALVVDLRTVDDARAGVQPGEGGTVLFWNLVKKSLGQSMPWIGLTAILLTGGIERDNRRVITTLLIFIAIFTMPFIALSWHGGGGSNMRYFLPVLPAIGILCAKLLRDLWEAVPQAVTFLAAGIWGAMALCVAWIFLHPSGHAGVQQIVATHVLLATTIAAIAAGLSWRFQQSARKLLIALCAGGLVIAATSAASDFVAEAQRRANSQDANDVVGELPTKSLVIVFPEWAVMHVPGNGSFLAPRDILTKQVDHQLILDSLNAGYRVFITPFEFDAGRDVPPGVEAVVTDYTYRGGRIIELRRGAASFSR
jgi:hypothetical protein